MAGSWGEDRRAPGHNGPAARYGSAQYPGHAAGQQVLQDLLRRPPAEIAGWALDQARDLEDPAVNVETLPIFQLAGALKAAPPEQKQALVRGAMSGFGDLPVDRRAEAVRLAMRSHDILNQAEGLELTRMAEREHAKAMQRLAALEQRQARLEGRPAGVAGASSPEAGGAPPGAGRGEAAQSRPPPLVENLLRVAKEARFNEMQKEDLTLMAQVAQGEAVRLMEPQQLLDVVSELDQGERQQLTEALVEAHVVPEEQRGVLEEAVRPGGYVDQLGRILACVNKARKYAWVFVAIPVIEFFLAVCLVYLSCGTPLVSWLRFDALLALGVAGAVYFTGHTLAPAYRKLNADPVGAVQRWQSMQQERRWRVKLEATVPGVSFDTYRAGAAGIAVLALLVLLGAVWAVIGALELLATLLMGCSSLTTLVCTVFVGARFGLLVVLLLGLYYVLDEIQRHRSRSPVLGSSLIPMSEDALPHDGHGHNQASRDFVREPLRP